MTKRQNGAGWNANKAVGQMEPFTLADIKWLCRYFAKQENWHDLCLVSAATDSWLRASDLLKLKVKDVTYKDGTVRRKWKRQQQKSGRGVYPVLSEQTRSYVAHWIKVSGKGSEDYLFTRTKAKDAKPISRAWYAILIKRWAELCGYQPEDFSTHSLRRTKPIYQYEQGEKVAGISKMLGHKSEASTLEYLGINQRQAEEASLRHQMIPDGLLPKDNGKQRLK